MKRFIYTSLVNNILYERADSDIDMWPNAAGKVIAGMDLHVKDRQLPNSILQDIPYEYREYPMAYLYASREQTWPGRRKQLQFAENLVLRDAQLGRQYAPRTPLTFMLDAACVMDREWKDKPRPIQWRIQNAIKVPIKRKNVRSF